MSKQAAIAFLQKVAEDATLQQKLIGLAKEQGYDFSVDELTEEDLGSVTGGALNAYFKLDSSLGSPTLNTISPQLNPSLTSWKISP